MKLKIYIISIFIAGIALCGCKKYLEAKSDESLKVINNLTDLQGLLDNYSKVNYLGPSADEASSDEYYLSFVSYQALGYEQLRNLYTWQPANVFYPYTNITNDWTQLYNTVYIANVVLDNMKNVPRTDANGTDWDNIKGQAHFLRAYAFLKTAGIWALAYDGGKSNSELGIPLRLTSNFNVPSTRSTVTETYNQIIEDTKKAIRLMSGPAIHPYRSGKPAAYALMAKTYLAMRHYPEAGLYADSCLQLYPTLIDFNNYNPANAYPITQFNKEVIYDTYAGGSAAQLIANGSAKIDPALYALYADNDLRTILFFKSNTDGTKAFRGSFQGTAQNFNGIATDEVYLIRAECYARAGKTDAAMADLNTLLRQRYKAGTFTDLTASDSADALSKILIERQKELVMRGTRWSDIKRLNKEGAGINLTRNVNGTIFSLSANDLRFALAIPEDIIRLSGIEQNPR